MEIDKEALFDRQQCQENNQKKSDNKGFFSAIPSGKIIEQICQFLPVCVCGKGLVNHLFALLFLEQCLYFFFQGLSHFENGVAVTRYFVKDVSGKS